MEVYSKTGDANLLRLAEVYSEIKPLDGGVGAFS